MTPQSERRQQLSLHHFDRALALGLRAHAHTAGLNDPLAVLVDASVELGHYVDAPRYLQTLIDRRPGLPAYARASYVRELNGDMAGAVEAMNLAVIAGAAGILCILGALLWSMADLWPAVPVLPGAAASPAAGRSVAEYKDARSACQQSLPLFRPR